MILYLLYAQAFFTLLLEMIRPRSLMLLGNPDLYLETVASENVYLLWISRAQTALFLFMLVTIIIERITYRKGLLPKQGAQFTFFWVIIFIPVLLSAFFSTRNDFHYNILFFPLLLIAAYLSPGFKIEEKIDKFLYIPLIFVYTSLFAAIFFPSWAFQYGYNQSPIGLPMRLFGMAPHPNILGSIAFSALVLQRIDNKKSQANLIHAIASIITILLSQSKTIWITLFIWVIVEAFIKFFGRRQQVYKIIGYGLLLTLLITTSFLLFQQKMLEDTFSSSITLTGRTDVWTITLDVWKQNPLLGYGPDIWNLDFRQTYGYLWAGQAHNQIMQTIGESGILGLLSLVVFYAVLIQIGSKYAPVTKGAAFGIVILILMRSFTEVPLRNYLIDMSFIMNSIFYIVLLNSHQHKRQM